MDLNLLYVSLFAVILIVILVLGARRRVLFRLGARNFIRHRTHSMLVVSGLLIGTAIIAGSMVTGDSIDNFIVKSTYDSLDLVDVEVAGHSNAYFNESIFWEVRNDSGVKGFTDGISPMIVTSAAVEDNTSGQYESSMSLMGFDPTLDRDFGSFTKTDGTTIYGDDLGANDVALNENAASKLDANAGDLLKVRYLPQGSMTGMERQFSVKYIVRDEGKGNFQLSANVFIRLDIAQSMLNASGQVNLIKISGIGDMRTGVEKSNDILNAVNATLLRSSDPAAKTLKVTATKQDSLEQSRMVGEMITTFLTIFGSFSIIAGVILIINIFTMLAEERKSELGMARAVGMTRKDLMQMFLFEGSTYTLAASACGTLAGLAIAYGIIYGVNNIIGMLGAFISIQIPFYFELPTLINAFCAGAIITFLTIIVASWRVTNINIVRAIRDIEEPMVEKGSKAMAVLGGILTFIPLLILVGSYDNLVMRYVAPCIAIIGIGLMLRLSASARIAYSVTGIGLIAWTFYSIATFFKGTGEDVQYLFISSGVFLVIAAVIIVMFNSTLVVSAISGSIGRIKTMRPVVKTAVSHPLNKRFRTGMTISMFTLVIYTIVMVSVFTGIFSMNVDDLVKEQGGGYQIIGNTQMPVTDISNASIYDPMKNVTIHIKSPTLENDVERVEQISVVFPTPKMKVEGKPYPGENASAFGSNVNMLAVDDHFIQYNRFGFTEMDKNYTTSQQVWWTLKNDSSKIVFGGSMGGFGGGFGGGPKIGVGTVFAMKTATGERNFTVIGIVNGLLSGVITTKKTALENFNAPGTFVMNVMFLFEVKQGRDVQEVTFGLEKDFRALGMNTINLRSIIQTMLDLISSIFQLFEVFLGLGLVVGIAGLGIITIRSVVERKREIGIMRAIGFERSKILASFVTEILFVATLAVVIGLSIGLVVAYEIFNVMVTGVDVTFTVPWMQIAWIIGITYAASLACTIVPAIRASRIPPAEALRINE